MELVIKSENLGEIENLLTEGYNPNEKTENNTPLIFLTENVAIIKLLLEYGADPKAVDEYGFTIEDYTDDEELKKLINEPRNPIIVSSTKFIKYRGTIKSIKKTNKTRRSRLQVEKSS